MSQQKTVVIIGAGPAGLTAAYELLKNHRDEYKVIILEESECVGGISKTVRYNGNRMDIGGHRFFSKDDNVMQWWSDMMAIQGSPAIDDKLLDRDKPLEQGGPDPEKQDRVMLIRERVSRIYYKRKFFDYPISMKPATFINMGLASTVAAGFSYLKSLVVKKEETSLENFYINRFGQVLYGMFFEKYTEKLWGRHPSEISASWGAQRVKGLSILALFKDVFRKIFHIKDKEVETSLIEQFWYPKYGPGQLWETVADEIVKMGGEIRFNCCVDRIEIKDSVIDSVTANGEKVEGDVFMSSMPVKDLVAGMNDVPHNVARIAAGLPYRDFITVGLLVDKLNLVNKTDKKTLGNIVPDCWIYVQEPDVKMGRIQIFNNWSPYMVKDPQKQVWIGLEYFCNENDQYWNMSDSDFNSFAVEELKKMGVLAQDAIVIDSHRERVKKAYPAYFDTYDEMDTLIEYLNRYDNLYCIGRNGQHRYNNMDHSMVTAFEAVNNIVSGRKNKDNIWNVNTEQEYHEKK